MTVNGYDSPLVPVQTISKIAPLFAVLEGIWGKPHPALLPSRLVIRFQLVFANLSTECLFLYFVAIDNRGNGAKISL